MKTLIVSDTHGNLNLYREVLRLNQVDNLIHLGDYYEDSLKVEFKEYCQTLYRVPGIYHPDYRSRSLSPTETLEIAGIPIILVHDIMDIDFTKVQNSLILYGHTHVHDVRKMGTNILINPGHLKQAVDRNQLASYLLLTHQQDELTIEWHQMKHGLQKTYKILKNKDNTLELNL